MKPTATPGKPDRSVRGEAGINEGITKAEAAGERNSLHLMNLANAIDLELPREGVGDELMRERVGLPRRRLMPCGDSRNIGALIGISVQDA